MKDMPDAVFDKVVEIKVLNAKKIIADALIGTFKVAPFHSNLSAFHSNLSVFHSSTYHSKYMYLFFPSVWLSAFQTWLHSTSCHIV